MSSVLLGATASVLVVALIVPSREALNRKQLMMAAPAAAPGGVAIFAGDATYFFALNRGVLATASVIAQLHPLWTALIAFRVLGERLNRWQMTALVCGGAGTALIGLAQSSH